MGWCCTRPLVPTKAGTSAPSSGRKAFAPILVCNFHQMSVQSESYLWAPQFLLLASLKYQDLFSHQTLSFLFLAYWSRV